jgi:hypothetical protein
MKSQALIVSLQHQNLLKIDIMLRSTDKEQSEVKQAGFAIGRLPFHCL